MYIKSLNVIFELLFISQCLWKSHFKFLFRDFGMFMCMLKKFRGNKMILLFGSLRTSLLCIMGEGEGFVALAVAVSDMWKVTSHMGHMTCDT